MDEDEERQDTVDPSVSFSGTADIGEKALSTSTAHNAPVSPEFHSPPHWDSHAWENDDAVIEVAPPTFSHQKEETHEMNAAKEVLEALLEEAEPNIVLAMPDSSSNTVYRHGAEMEIGVYTEAHELMTGRVGHTAEVSNPEVEEVGPASRCLENMESEAAEAGQHFPELLNEEKISEMDQGLVLLKLLQQEMEETCQDTITGGLELTKPESEIKRPRNKADHSSMMSNVKAQITGIGISDGKDISDIVKVLEETQESDKQERSHTSGTENSWKVLDNTVMNMQAVVECEKGVENEPLLLNDEEQIEDEKMQHGQGLTENVVGIRERTEKGLAEVSEAGLDEEQNDNGYGYTAELEDAFHQSGKTAEFAGMTIEVERRMRVHTLVESGSKLVKSGVCSVDSKEADNRCDGRNSTVLENLPEELNKIADNNDNIMEGVMGRMDNKLSPDKRQCSHEIREDVTHLGYEEPGNRNTFSSAQEMHMDKEEVLHSGKVVLDTGSEFFLAENEREKICLDKVAVGADEMVNIEKESAGNEILVDGMRCAFEITEHALEQRPTVGIDHNIFQAKQEMDVKKQELFESGRVFSDNKTEAFMELDNVAVAYSPDENAGGMHGVKMDTFDTGKEVGMIDVAVADTPASIVDFRMEEVDADTDISAVEPGMEETVSEDSEKGFSSRNKRHRNSKSLARVPLKKVTEEDVCFICFDGGDLVLCDRRGCPKAYHPSCVNRDEAFFRAKGRWNCGWHLCSICEKNAHYMCYTCTYSLCKGCIQNGVILCVRGNKGFCDACMQTVSMIEEYEKGSVEMVQVDFNDQSSWEFLFKDYYMDLKNTINLTHDEVLKASNPWKSLDSSCNRQDPIEEYDSEYGGQSDSDSDSDQPEARRPRKRRSKKSSISLKTEGNSTSGSMIECLIAPGQTEWASKELLEFVMHMRNGDTSVLSQFDVQALLLEYIKENKLRDPKRKSYIICDLRLQSIFRKARVGHFEMLKLLESHFLLKESSGKDDAVINFLNGAAATDLDAEGSADTSLKPGKTKKRKMHKKGGGKGMQSNLDDFAAIDMHNINLIYLSRNLMEELLGDVEHFHDKTVGSFVRLKLTGNSHKQDVYRLVQVVGTSKAEKHYKVGKKTTDIMLEILNLHKTESISIDILSNHEFTEEECKRLRQSMKFGILSRLSVGEILEKATALHTVRVNDTVEAEIVRLENLRDRASETGRRKQLRECVEKLQLLKATENRQQRLDEVPLVHADPNMDPSHESEDEEEENNRFQDIWVRRPKDGGGYRGRRNTPPSPAAATAATPSPDPWSSSPKFTNSNWDTSRRSQSQAREVRPKPDREAKEQPQPSPPEESRRPPPPSETTDGDKVWHYKDPSGKEQGPFSMVQLRKWSNTGYFPSDLRIWRATERQQDTVLLTSILKGQPSRSHPSPQPHAAAATTPNPVLPSPPPPLQVVTVNENHPRASVVPMLPPHAHAVYGKWGGSAFPPQGFYPSPPPPPPPVVRPENPGPGWVAPPPPAMPGNPNMGWVMPGPVLSWPPPTVPLLPQQPYPPQNVSLSWGAPPPQGLPLPTPPQPLNPAYPPANNWTVPVQGDAGGGNWVGPPAGMWAGAPAHMDQTNNANSNPGGNTRAEGRVHPPSRHPPFGNDAKGNQRCKFFDKGRCRFGSSCDYLHDSKEPR